MILDWGNIADNAMHTDRQIQYTMESHVKMLFLSEIVARMVCCDFLTDEQISSFGCPKMDLPDLNNSTGFNECV